MNMKKWLALALVLCLGASMAGCSKEGAVYVQSVESLAALGGIAPGDRFSGLVVSENVTEITKDENMSVKELLVKEGDDVKEGQELFSYDMDEIQLTLDKQKLELEQLNATIENYKEQLKTLEKERKSASGNAKLQYTVEIQSMELDLKETELKIKTKNTEIARSEELLTNSVVTSPIQGRVQAVSENGYDNYGNPLPYITIQQSGSYRVKGMLGELQRGGIMEGSRLTVFSRTTGETWGGTVVLVDYENPSQGNDMNMYYGNTTDEMTASSKYPFYVQLDSVEGLLLGQHVYMELEAEEAETQGVSISGAFLCYNDDGTAYVWAEKGSSLEKRPVTLGEYNPMQDTFEILEGLTEEDYIAFPDAELCVEGAPTTHDQPVTETQPQEGGDV